MCPWPQILKRLKRGDEAAFGIVVDRLGPALLSYLRRMVGDEHEAEELFNETWLRFARGVRRVRRAEAIRSYLLRIASNLVRNELAARRRDPLASSEVLNDCRLVRVRAAATSEADCEERCNSLRDAIARLAPALREVVVLRTYGQMKFREIADALGLPLGTVLTRMRRAIRELREMLR